MLKGKDFINLSDFSSQELADILEYAEELKGKQKDSISHHLLSGKTLAMLFEKTSTRTRVSFEVGMYQLGGHALFLEQKAIQLGGTGETIGDTAKVLARYVDGIMARVFAHRNLEEMAANSTIPIINGLSDDSHPCQIMADLLTVKEEFEELKGLRLAYIGDGNNVANSLLVGCAKFGMDVAIATPEGFEPSSKYFEVAKEIAAESGSKIVVTSDAKEAVADADVIYTDTWISMGDEAQKEERLKVFPPYQLNRELLGQAKPTAIVLHCLPAHRGYEITDEVMDGPQSRVFEQAENRLHVQKAIMALTM
ncbi:MAG: ornithine carbamoyltransferase [Candidatus Hodarchaeales archaeon]|jgi:ornithine carbamoyltransferase